jgi:tRNA threonylcarbamoyladenosine biosynthesis protein TsaB
MAIREDKSAGYSHAEKLHVFIEEVLAEAGLVPTQLDAVAVSKGPGSYTGLRIGVSAAKGLCFALDLPLIALPTLQLLDHQVTDRQGYVVPMLDARRMEVYTAVFDAAHQEVVPTRALILDQESFKDLLSVSTVTFVGTGVAKFEAVCGHANAHFIPDIFPSAKEMGALAFAKYQIGDTEDVAYFEPYYLKDFKVG